MWRAESAGASLIVARYWWVARQGAKAVSEAEAIASTADAPVPDEGFVDPLPELTRVV